MKALVADGVRCVLVGALAAGNALSTAAVQAGSLLGPALGGALVAATQASTSAFGVDAASFGISALTLAFIRPKPVSETVADEPPPPAEGALSLLRRSRALQVLLMVVIAANLSSGGMGDVALPALAHATFGPAGYGALLACLAVGGMAGALVAAAVLFGLTQREFLALGAAEGGEARVTAQAAEGSRK